MTKSPLTYETFMIGFNCGNCGKRFEVQDTSAGKTGRCKQCGALMKIPAASAVFEVEEPIAPPRSRPQAQPIQVPVRPEPFVAPVPTQNVQVVVNQIDRKAANGLGVAGVIIGVVAIGLGWIPVVGLLAFPLVIIGGLLSFIGLLVAHSSKRSGISWPLTGMGLNAFALTLVIVVNLVLTGFAGGVVRGAREAARRAEAQRIAKEAKLKAPIAAPRPVAAP